MRRGTLRELPKDALRRADALVLHNVDLLGGWCRLKMDRCRLRAAELYCPLVLWNVGLLAAQCWAVLRVGAVGAARCDLLGGCPLDCQRQLRGRRTLSLMCKRFCTCMFEDCWP